MTTDEMFRALRTVTNTRGSGALHWGSGRVTASWVWGNPATLEEESWRAEGRSAEVALQRLLDTVTQARAAARSKRARRSP